MYRRQFGNPARNSPGASYPSLLAPGRIRSSIPPIDLLRRRRYGPGRTRPRRHELVHEWDALNGPNPETSGIASGLQPQPQPQPEAQPEPEPQPEPQPQPVHQPQPQPLPLPQPQPQPVHQPQPQPEHQPQPQPQPVHQPQPQPLPQPQPQPVHQPQPLPLPLPQPQPVHQPQPQPVHQPQPQPQPQPDSPNPPNPPNPQRAATQPDPGLSADSDEDSEWEREAVPKPPVELTEEELDRELHVQRIDLHVQANSEKHHTDIFECTDPKDSDNPYDPELIVRRGEEFDITIYLDRPYDLDKHNIKLVFKSGEIPSVLDRSYVEIPIVEEDGNDDYMPSRWGATITNIVDNAVDVAVFPPCTCLIGEWELYVKTIVPRSDVDPDDVEIWEYECPDDVTVLFNPWCTEDAVYMPNDVEEYVLNESGVIYRGNYRNIAVKNWNYGQFHRGVLDAALHLMYMGFGYRSWGRNGDPVKISRALSQVVNYSGGDVLNPNYGVVVGNWSGRYKNGKHPSAWTGSVKILRQFMSTKKPVKYGQCWVFAGVLTTVCRSLGIPARTITNYASAHDTDVSLTIDEFVDESENEINRMNSDAVWNFHVWNEAYMKRPDLGDEFSGWQIIDSTPQESSEGVMCCGPAPQVAVRSGEVNVSYDTKFVFAEVNSDRITWLMTSKGQYRVIGITTSSVGKRVSTHRPTGRPFHRTDESLERLDITNQYKFPEGSKKEREIVKQAARFSAVLNTRDPYNVKQDESIKVTISTPDDVIVGANDFEVQIVIHNESAEVRTCRLFSIVRAMTYTGILFGKPILKHKFNPVKVFPRKDEKLTYTVNGFKAYGAADESFQYRIVVKCLTKIGRNTDIQQLYHDFRYRMPELKFEGPLTCRKNEVITVKVSLKNPLHVPLTECVLDLEGSLVPVEPTKDTMTLPDIQPKTTWTRNLSLVARKTQRNKMIREMTATLDTRELREIDGAFAVDIVN